MMTLLSGIQENTNVEIAEGKDWPYFKLTHLAGQKLLFRPTAVRIMAKAVQLVAFPEISNTVSKEYTLIPVVSWLSCISKLSVEAPPKHKAL